MGATNTATTCRELRLWVGEADSSSRNKENSMHICAWTSPAHFWAYEQQLLFGIPVHESEQVERVCVLRMIYMPCARMCAIQSAHAVHLAICASSRFGNRLGGSRWFALLIVKTKSLESSYGDDAVPSYSISFHLPCRPVHYVTLFILKPVRGQQHWTQDKYWLERCWSSCTIACFR